MTSKEDILKELPADVLSAKVSAEDLLKFSPVLQQEQQKNLQRQRQSVGEVEYDDRPKTGIFEYAKKNPFAIGGIFGAVYCFCKGVSNTHQQGSHKADMKWMQGRLYWQSFAIVSMLGGHYYYSMKHMEKLEVKRAQYERERDIVCKNAHISPEVYEEMKYRESVERNYGGNDMIPLQELKRRKQVDQDFAERGETVYLSPEKRIAIENSSIGASLSSTDFMRLGIRSPSI